MSGSYTRKMMILIFIYRGHKVNNSGRWESFFLRKILVKSMVWGRMRNFLKTIKILFRSGSTLCACAWILSERSLQKYFSAWTAATGARKIPISVLGVSCGRPGFFFSKNTIFLGSSWKRLCARVLGLSRARVLTIFSKTMNFYKKFRNRPSSRCSGR